MTSAGPFSSQGAVFGWSRFRLDQVSSARMVSRYKRPAPYLPAPIPGKTARRNMSDVIGAGTA